MRTAILTLAISLAITTGATANVSEEHIARRSLGGGDELVVHAVRDGDDGRAIRLSFTDGRTLVDKVTLLLPPAQARAMIEALKLGSADREGLSGDEMAMRTVTAGDTQVQLIAKRRRLEVLFTQDDENVMLFLRDGHIRRIERDVEDAIAAL